MFVGFDHLIVVVTDLDYAVRCYEQFGYAVTRRNDAAKGNAENRLVCFQDGSYLEILFLTDPAYRARHRMTPILARSGSGWADYSLHSDDIDADCARLAAAGVASVMPSDFTKTLETGETWTVRVMPVGAALGRPVLPFIAMDATPRRLRVPDTATVHPNGAAGIAGVRLLTADLHADLHLLDSLYGSKGETIAPPAGGVAARRWTFAQRFVEVVQPGPEDSGLRRHFDRRGEGVYQVFVANPSNPGIPDQEFANGGSTIFV